MIIHKSILRLQTSYISIYLRIYLYIHTQRERGRFFTERMRPVRFSTATLSKRLAVWVFCGMVAVLTLSRVGLGGFGATFVDGADSVSSTEGGGEGVPTILPPHSNNLAAFLRNVHRDPEIGYLYKNLQHYVVDRVQRAAVREPKVGNEVEIFNDLLDNHGQDDRTVYSAEERKVVKAKVVELVQLMNISHVTGNGDL